MAMNPNLAVAYYWASKALLSLGDWAGSVQVLRCALQQKPSPAESLKLRACILYAYNDDKEASQLLEQSLRMEPLDAALHFELGRCYQGLEKYSTANEYYTTALKLHYDLPCAVLDHRAECLLHSGHVEEALADLKSSFDALPDPFVARKIEAILNEFRRDLREAFQDYLPQGKSPTEVSSKCACVGPACLCLDNGVGPRHVDQEVMALQSNASVLVSEGRIQAAVDLLTQWLACNEAHEDRACQYVFRGELCGVLCDWEGAIRDYTTASEIVRHATDPAASPTLSFYLERIEELRCRQLQTASDNGAP
jgi:tetratricopeptide (TPR) repeat protein